MCTSRVVHKSTDLFQRGGSAEVRQKSILEQSIEGDLILNAVDPLEEQDNGRFVLRRQASSDRCTGHHLGFTILMNHLAYMIISDRYTVSQKKFPPLKSP